MRSFDSSSTTRRADRARFAVALLRRGLPRGALAGDAGDLLGLLARCYRGAKGDDALQTDVVIVAAALLKREPESARRWAPRLARVALQTLRRVAAIASRGCAAVHTWEEWWGWFPNVERRSAATDARIARDSATFAASSVSSM